MKNQNSNTQKRSELDARYKRRQRVAGAALTALALLPLGIRDQMGTNSIKENSKQPAAAESGQTEMQELPAELKGEVGAEPIILILRPGAALHTAPEFTKDPVGEYRSEENVADHLDEIVALTNPIYKDSKDGRFYLVPMPSSSDRVEQKLYWVSGELTSQTAANSQPYAEVTYIDPNEIRSEDYKGHLAFSPEGLNVIGSDGQTQAVSTSRVFKSEADLHKAHPMAA